MSDPVRDNLPLQLSSFVGRDREIAEVRRLLSVTRLLTLTGAGGCGKTRLALQVAADSLDDFRDGIWFVDLAPLSDSSLVAQMVATAFGLSEEEKPAVTRIVMDYLREKNLLLILDNCEHLLDACAKFADTALRSSPNVKVLATSRQALDIPGETAFRVPSLTLPENSFAPLEALSTSDAVRLFLERARAAQPSFTLTERNSLSVAQICQRLDGIPLAIELVAARVKSLSVAEIAARLDDLFGLLTSGNRLGLPRQQTLRASIEWSYDLLSDPERVLLRRLSVFSGGWTLQAAEEVCSDGEIKSRSILDLQSQLIEKSLVIVDEQKAPTRYQFLETIREYAREKLNESGDERPFLNCQLDFYLKLAETAQSNGVRAEQLARFQALERDHDNMRAALEWSVSSNQSEKGLRLGIALHPFWFTRGHWDEGYQKLRTLLEMQGQDQRTLTRGKALRAAGGFSHYLGLLDDSRIHFEESIAILQEIGSDAQRDLEFALSDYSYAFLYWDLESARQYAEQAARLSRTSANRFGLGQSLNVLGFISTWTSDFEAARNFLEEALANYREIGIRDYPGFVTNLGWTYLFQGDLKGAAVYFGKSLGMARELEDKRNAGIAITGLGNIARLNGQHENAESLLNQAIAELSDLASKRLSAIPILLLGRLQLSKRNYSQAEKCFKDSLTLFKDTNAQIYVPQSLESFACLLSAMSSSTSALQLFSAADALREKLGIPLPPIDRIECEPCIRDARSKLDEASFNTAWKAGRAMSFEDAISVAEHVRATEDHAHTAPAHPAGLTDREVEVLRFLARGLSNQEIADTLVLSKRTVEAHLRSIFSKLDVTTRSAATRAAIERHLD